MSSEIETGLDLRIVPLTIHHLPQVLEIERVSFRDPWTGTMFAEALGQSDTHWAAFVGGSLVGYLVSQWVADEVHVLNVAVAEEWRRRGIASALLRHLFERAILKNMRDVFLEVRVSNRPALALYHRFGFSELSVRSKYYRDGEDAYVMHCSLPLEQEESQCLSAGTR